MKLLQTESITCCDVNKNQNSSKQVPHILLLEKKTSQIIHLTLLVSFSPLKSPLVLSKHQPSHALPDGAFDTCPDRAFQPLCSSYVIPVQPGVGNLILWLWVGSCAVFGTRHHHGQKATLRLKLYNMEQLLVSQSLVGFLRRNRRGRHFYMETVTGAMNLAASII